MCDNDFLMVDVPKASLENIVMAYSDFKRSPGDHESFMRLDWALRVAMAKWESYSLQRKVEACG
jgi:hypothetical protein